MINEKKGIMFWVWPETHSALKAQAKKERSTITALMNRLVSDYLKKVNR
jgi:hypothetical protein